MCSYYVSHNGPARPSIVFLRGDLFDVDNGGSATGLAAAVKTLLDTMPAHARFVTGHGRVMDHAGLQTYHSDLVPENVWIRTIAAGRAADDDGRGGL